MDIRSRLREPDAKVRRLALRDLLGSHEPPAEDTLDAVITMLGSERDPGAMELAARVLGRWAYAPGRNSLHSLISSRETPVLAAHEARAALDMIELVIAGRMPAPARPRKPAPPGGPSGTMGP